MSPAFASGLVPLRVGPAYRAVSDDLRRRILAGEIGPGESLPTETDLAERLGVHRSTVREGLRHLEQDGLVQRDGKRLVVRVPDSGDVGRVAERALRMRQVSYGDVWELASTLEPMCARLAAQRISASELAALAHNLERTQAIVARHTLAVDETMEFQDLVAQAAHNQALLIARAPVSLLMRAGYAAIAQALPQSGARLLSAHRRVYEALRTRDEDAAVTWTQKHMRDYRRGCTMAGIAMDAAIPAGD